MYRESDQAGFCTRTLSSQQQRSRRADLALDSLCARGGVDFHFWSMNGAPHLINAGENCAQTGATKKCDLADPESHYCG